MRDIIWGTEIGRTPIADIQRLVIDKLDSYSIYSSKSAAILSGDSDVSAYRPVNLGDPAASVAASENSSSTTGSIA